VNTAILCMAALSMLRPVAVTEVRVDTCHAIVAEARAQGLPPHIALAVAYVESRYSPDAVSPAGAVGPLQILPKWHCPGRTADGCDLIAEGVRLLHRNRYRWGDWPRVWCHYQAGNRCTERGQRYADKVQLRADALRVMAMALGLWADEGLRPPGRL